MLLGKHALFQDGKISIRSSFPKSEKQEQVIIYKIWNHYYSFAGLIFFLWVLLRFFFISGVLQFHIVVILLIQDD